MQKARNAFLSGKTRNIDFRIRQLENLLRLYEENGPQLVEALYKDLRKPKHEGILLELSVMKTDVKTMIENCREWAAPLRVILTIDSRQIKIHNST